MAHEKSYFHTQCKGNKAFNVRKNKNERDSYAELYPEAPQGHKATQKRRWEKCVEMSRHVLGILIDRPQKAAQQAPKASPLSTQGTWAMLFGLAYLHLATCHTVFEYRCEKLHLGFVLEFQGLVGGVSTAAWLGVCGLGTSAEKKVLEAYSAVGSIGENVAFPVSIVQYFFLEIWVGRATGQVSHFWLV